MNTERFSFRPGDPPRVAVAWRTDVLGSVRTIVVTVDGAVLSPEPRREGGAEPWVFRMADGRQLVAQWTMRPLGGESVDVRVDGHLLPGGEWEPRRIGRRAAVLCVSLAAANVAFACLLRGPGWLYLPQRFTFELLAEAAILSGCAADLRHARRRGAYIAAGALFLAAARIPYVLTCLELPVRVGLAVTFVAVARSMGRKSPGATPPP